MDFARKHRLPDEDDDAPTLDDVLRATNLVREMGTPVGGPMAWDDGPTLVVMEAGSEARLGDWIVRAIPRPWPSFWARWGIKRRPRRS